MNADDEQPSAHAELHNIVRYVERIAESRVRNGRYDDGFIDAMLDVGSVIRARLNMRTAWDVDTAAPDVTSALSSLLEWWRAEPGFAVIFRDFYPELAIRIGRLDRAHRAEIGRGGEPS